MNETLAEENPLSRDFDIKSLLKFALPTIIMMLLMGLYTIVDTIFVARFVGTNALSALNIVCPVINLIVGLGTMLDTGGERHCRQEDGGRGDCEGITGFHADHRCGCFVWSDHYGFGNCINRQYDSGAWCKWDFIPVL